jgi:hypothetical protein
VSSSDDCELCGARGGCSCARSRDHLVVVAGIWARIVRDGNGYAIYIEDDDVPAFRASGSPSAVIALAEISLGQRDVLALAEDHMAAVDDADPGWPALERGAPLVRRSARRPRGNPRAWPYCC